MKNNNLKGVAEYLLSNVDDTNEKGLKSIIGFIEGILNVQVQK